MLRGLMIRQGLRGAYVVMAVLFVVILAVSFRQALGSGINLDQVSQPDTAGKLQPLDIPTVKDRSHYDAILASNLLGPAGKYDPNKAPSRPEPAPVPASDVEEDTSLPLRLLGTSVNKRVADLAAAVIEVRRPAPNINTFYPNDEIMDAVLLKEVRVGEVVLDNRRTQRLEVLRLEHAQPGSNPASMRSRRQSVTSARPTRPSTVVASGGLVTLQRDEIVKQLEDEYARVASSLVVREVKDESGKTKGITTDNIEDYDVAQELGFKNGDVLVSINNEPVTSRDDAMRILSKYQNASIFRIGLERGGSVQYITYRVR